LKIYRQREELKAKRAGTPAEAGHKKAMDGLLKIFGNYGVAEDIVNAIEMGLIDGIKATYTTTKSN
jgi:hypothetical protein